MRRNSFDLIRLVAAALVLYGHSFTVAGRDSAQVFGVPVEALGVAIFFAASGYLISASWGSDPRLGAFVWKRCLRILPALVPLALVLVVIARLGMFDGNLRTDLDTPLWTLPIEARCYLLAALLGLVGALRRPTGALVLYLAVVLMLAWVKQPPVFSALVAIGGWLTPKYGGHAFLAVMLTATFIGGALMHHVPRRRVFAVLALALLVLHPVAPYCSLALAVPYLVVYVAECGVIRLRHDLSYGVYIWGWPAQQTMVALGLAAPLVVFSLALPAAAVVAFASWTVVEARALRLKSRLLVTSA